MRTKGEVISWGEVLWDLFEDGPRLGGCAANVAHHLAGLGVATRLVSRVGEDELGQQALDQLNAIGVDTSTVQRDTTYPTGTVRVQTVRGEPTFTIAAQAAWDRIEWNRELASAVSTARVLYFGTLAQRTPLGGRAMQRAWASAPPSCVRVCDVNVRAPLPAASVIEASLRAAHVVKLNEREAQTLCEIFGVSEVERWLLEECQVRLVALTRGARGCRLETQNEHVEHPGFSLASNAGDRVGAGDAFTAVLCEALLGGELTTRDELARLAARANRIAGYVASCTGATPPLPASLLAASP